MEDVSDVYERPYDESHPVICPDESPIRLIGERREPYTDKRGIGHIGYEQTRNGTADLFMISEPSGGIREVLAEDRHPRFEWTEVIRHIAEDMYPNAEKPNLILIQDNLSAHKRSASYEIMEPERAREIPNRIGFVSAPRHGSLPDIAETELSVLTRQELGHRVGNKEEPEQQITEWHKERK